MAPLSGIRVVDLTQYEAGTSCTQSLAWLGAEVIKIEPPRYGEQGRISSRDIPDIDSPYFLLLNANKQSVALDLKSEQGKKIIRKLIESADVFVENFGPGAIERLGLSYDDVAAINPRIVYGTIKGYDPEGPFGSYLSMDPIGQAMGGSIAITGLPDGTPVRPGPTMADTGSGLHLTIGILAALRERDTSGEGQKVSVSMQEAMINFCRISYSRTISAGDRPVERAGSGMGLKAAPARLYVCKPGGPNDYIYVYASRTPQSRHWDRILETIGREDLKGDPRFLTAESRWEHREIVDGMISEWTGQRTKIEAVHALAGAGVPAGAVMNPAELAEDPHLNSNGAFVKVSRPDRGEYKMPGWPVKMSRWKPTIVAAPTLGADTREVLSTLAEVTDSELDELESDGVI